MTSKTKFSAGVCAAALLSAGTAQADVTATQVWENWKESYTLYGDDGLTVGSETLDGGTLTVSDLALSADEGNTSIDIQMGDLVFEEQGDGTVRVTMPASYPMVFTDLGTEFAITVSQNDMEMVVSGSPESMNYDFDATSLTFTVDTISENGEPVVDGDIVVSMNELSGGYVTEKNNLQNIASTFSLGSLDMLVDISNIDGAADDTIVLSGKLNNLDFSGNISLPLDMENVNPDEIFELGLGLEGRYSVESANYIFDIQADGMPTAGTFSNGQTNFEIAMTNEALLYDVGTADLNAEIVSSDLPFPINIALDEYAIGFSMPLSKSEEPKDFAFLVKLVNLAVNDEIWMLGDPGGALARDPATIIMDITGQARLFYDITNPAEMDAVDAGAVPGELISLNLNDLQLSFGGADVTGEGGFTFDNSDMTTFDGIPRPEGSVTVNVDGANQLMGALVQMGLLPEDQMMMAQMMIGMFAQQTGDDSLTSTIEVNDQGHLLANGQRLQ